MWILAILFWKRPRLAQNIVVGWLFLMGAELTVIAPGQLYIRSVNPTSPYVYPVAGYLLVAACVAGPLSVTGAIWFLVARARRDRAVVKHPTPAHDVRDGDRAEGEPCAS